MQLTKISQQQKSADRVNLYIDGEFRGGLEKNDLLELGLFVGKEITATEFEQLLGKIDSGKIRHALERYLSLRPRSTREVETYLSRRKGMAADKAQELIDYYKHLDLINDEKFCDWLIKNRLELSGWGIRKIEQELISKGIDRKLIATKLRESSDAEPLQSASIQKFLGKAQNQKLLTGDYNSRQKLIQKLLRKGFDYEKIKEEIEHLP